MALVATYPPRHCGIATFTADLYTALSDAPGGWTPQVAAVDRGRGDPRRYPSEVVRRLAGTHPAEYRHLGGELNGSADAVLLQHEYGIYGGPSGAHVLELADALHLPLVTTFHTVRSEPTAQQERILRALAGRSDVVVAMTSRSRDLLVGRYGVDEDRVRVIPHGVPTFEPMAPRAARRLLGLADGPTLLSFGLLGPGKGIELVIDAFARITSHVPNAQYVILGATHPEVRRRHGEAYRRALVAQAAEAGLSDRIVFVDRYVDPDELTRWLQASDAFVTAYANAEQASSGTLSLAVAAGRTAVSTPYAHARELLADGRGVLVGFGDADAMAEALARVLGDEALRRRIGGRAKAYAATMAWPIVGQAYQEALTDARSRRRALVDRAAGNRPRPPGWAFPVGPALEPPAVFPIPDVERRHLDRLRGAGGIWQHAVGRFPDSAHGTCTDDVARALLVDLAHAAAEPSATTNADLRADLRYLDHAFNADTGRFRNLRAADGRWLEEVGSEDAHGRALQALGSLIGQSDDALLVARARRLFIAARPAAERLAFPRARAHATIGAVAALSAGQEGPLREMIARLAQPLADAAARASADWPWPEPVVTYDNGILPQALIEAGAALERAQWVRLGLAQLSWLCRAQTAPEGHLRPVGNRGWWPRGEVPARFDQQPIEAGSLLEAASAAFRATGDPRWTSEMIRAFRWFVGANDLGLTVADPASGACADGLGPREVSVNCGAESTVVWLRSVELIREAFRDQRTAGLREDTSAAALAAAAAY